MAVSVQRGGKGKFEELWMEPQGEELWFSVGQAADAVTLAKLSLGEHKGKLSEGGAVARRPKKSPIGFPHSMRLNLELAPAEGSGWADMKYIVSFANGSTLTKWEGYVRKKEWLKLQAAEQAAVSKKQAAVAEVAKAGEHAASVIREEGHHVARVIREAAAVKASIVREQGALEAQIIREQAIRQAKKVVIKVAVRSSPPAFCLPAGRLIPSTGT